MSDEADELSSGPSCYRNKFSGVYKTISPGDIVFPSNEWIFIHTGSCSCEGQVAGLDCTEPGDDGA